MKVNIINYARGLTLRNAGELGTAWLAYEIEINLKRVAREGGSTGDPGHDSSPAVVTHGESGP